MPAINKNKLRWLPAERVHFSNTVCEAKLMHSPRRHRAVSSTELIQLSLTQLIYFHLVNE